MHQPLELLLWEGDDGRRSFSQDTLQEEQTSLEKELQKEEKQSVDVKQFLSVVRKYTNLTELTPEIVHEFIDKI